MNEKTKTQLWDYGKYLINHYYDDIVHNLKKKESNLIIMNPVTAVTRNSVSVPRSFLFQDIDSVRA